MRQRTITAIIMSLIFIPFFFLGGWFTVIFFTILAYIGGYELITMYEKKQLIPTKCKYIIPLFSSIIVLYGGFASSSDMIYVCLVELALIILLPIFNKRILMKDAIFFIFTIIYTGITFTLIANVRNIDSLYRVELFDTINIYIVGLIYFLFTLLTTMLTDIFAYCFGMKFGKHKLCPSISPKKSIEGSVAGTIFGALGGTLFMFGAQCLLKENAIYINLFKIENTFLSLLTIFIVAIILSIAGQLGDLIASKIKREYEIKDYGKLFPGHGGVLDRFDSSIYSFLIFNIILMIIGVL